MALLAFGILFVYLFFRFTGADSIVLRWWCIAWALPAMVSIPIDVATFDGFTGGFSFILLATSFLGLGSLLARAASPVVSNQSVTLDPERGMRRLLWLSILLSWVSVQLLMLDLGTSFKVFFSIEELISNAVAASVARYHEDFNPAFRTRIMLCFLYLSGFLAGWLVAQSDRRVRFLEALLAFLPAVAWMVLLTTKASVLFWLVFALAGFLSFATKGALKRSLGLIIALPVLLGGLLALLFWTQLSRYGGDMAEAKYVYSNFLVSAVGHVFAFREWFDREFVWLPTTFGTASFAGVAEVLGGAVRKAGLYGYADIYVGDASTNVYSALRPLVEDVGVVFALIFFLLIGLIGTTLERRGTLISRALLASILAWVLWSPITSVFNYNSIIFACVLLVLIAVGFALQGGKRTHTHP